MNAPRIWDKKKKIMYHPDQVCRLHFTKSKLYGVVLWDGSTLFNKDFIALKPTGLPDKNGTKIFEGDICKDYMGYLHKVIWDKKYLSFMFERADGTLLSGVGQNAEGFQAEVIGNIYENPEFEFKPLKQKRRK